MNKKSRYIPMIFLVLACSFILRTFNLNWDDGYHFHPDERAIVLKTLDIGWVNPVSDWETFSKASSRMNPKWFAYGSMPLYLLKFSAWIVSEITGDYVWSGYDGIVLVGRTLSALFDTGTVLLVFLLARRLLSVRGALIAAAWYGMAVFPIQLSHFYAVDTFLNFFAMLVLWAGVEFVQTKQWRWLLVMGIGCGLALGTKNTGVLLGIPVVFSILAVALRSFKSIRTFDVFELLGKLVVMGGLVAVVGLSIFVTVEPYAILDWDTFVRDSTQQSKMASDAWVFPYTRQYVGTLPYAYPAKQILQWGLGWGLGLLAIWGLACLLWQLAEFWGDKKRRFGSWIVLLGFAITYWWLFGGFEVKFMRYMLPLYPLLCIFAVVGAVYIGILLRSHWAKVAVTAGVSIFTGVWLICFMSIYTQENPRITASRWMAEELPVGSRLGVEHWDDSLPVPPWHVGFEHVSLPLYEFDTDRKWREISGYLERVDVLVLASNRLYVPLMRLPERYATSSRYYELLFAEQLGFELAGEFTSYPQLGGFDINDQGADESFTVYDHPRVLIYVKREPKTASEYFDLIMGRQV